MRCPHCQHQHEEAYECPNCHLASTADQALEMHQIAYLLHEIQGWTTIPSNLLTPLIEKYESRRQALEITLGLRATSLSLADAHQLRQNLANYEAWSEWVRKWLRHQQMSLDEAQGLQATIDNQIQVWQQQWATAPELPPETTREYHERTLEAARFVLVQAEEMVESGVLKATAVYDLTDDIMALEIQLSLRHTPAIPDPEITLLTPTEEALAQKAKRHSKPPSTPEPEPEPEPEPAKQPQPPRERRNPITWDNIWETLLSERTLRAILFLAVLLLFSGAVSIVVNEWQSFPRWAQAGFLAGFTAVFYGLGSFVRQRLKLVGSGLALTAVASLLVPLDFYTFYLSGGFPADSGAAVWILTSVVCIIAYTATAYHIQAESFGYLVALAGGSLVLSLANWVGLDSVWWQPLTVVYAMSLVRMAQVVTPHTNNLALFTRPFWHVALVGTAVSLLINLMLLLLRFTIDPTALLATALSWWLACALAALAIRRYPLQITVLGMAVAPFIAMWFTQAWFANLWGWPVATYAIGWTLLMPLYLAVWLGLKHLERTDSDGYTIKKEFVPNLASPVADGANIILGFGLIALSWAALWALSDFYITSVVHSLLAIYAGVTAVRLHRPILLWLTGLLVMSSSGALLAALHQPPAMLGLVWSGLALIVLGLAVWLANKEVAADIDTTLARIAVPLAGFAIFPALMPPEHNILLVTVGVWMGVNLIWAGLTHGRGWLLIPFKPFQTNKNYTLWPWSQWLAVLPIMPYLYLWGARLDLSVVSLATLFIVAGYILLAVALWLQRLVWQYRWPWLVIANLCQLLVIPYLVTFSSPTVPPAVGWVAVAGFFLVQAWQTNDSWSAAVGLLLFPLGWLRLMPYLGTFNETWLSYAPIGVALILLAYELTAVWLRQQAKASTRPWLKPLTLVPIIYITLYVLGGTLFLTRVWFFEPSATWLYLDDYTAVTFLILSATTAVHSWQSGRERWAFITLAWFLAGAGLWGINHDTGTGLAAVVVALLAAALFLGERGLHQVARQRQEHKAWRKLWRLYRRTLKRGGWLVTAVALYLALWHNLFQLELTSGRQGWSLMALALLGGLFLACAHLYRRPVFTLLASITAVPVWLLAVDLVFNPHLNWLGASLVVLALLLSGLVTAVFNYYQRAQKMPSALNWHGRVALAVAQVLVPFSIVATYATTSFFYTTADDSYTWLAATWVLGLSTLFYVAATWQDAHFRLVNGLWRGRFLSPLLLILPLFIVNLASFLPVPASFALGEWLMMGVGLLILLAAHSFYHQEHGRVYTLSLMLLAYWLAFLATSGVSGNQVLFIAFLLLDAGLCILSAVRLQKPNWLFPALIFLPWALGLAMRDAGVPLARLGWGWLVLGAALLALGWFLGRDHEQVLYRRRETTSRVAYSRPILVGAFNITIVGMLACFFLSGYGDAAVGYLAAALILALMGRWLRLTLVWHVAVGLLVAAYSTVAIWQSPRPLFALAMWPLIIGLLALGRTLDVRWEQTKLLTLWSWQPDDKLTDLGYLLTNWWAFSAYLLAFLAIINSTAVAWQRAQFPTLLIICLLSLTTFVWAMYYFRWRVFTLCAALWGQLAGYALISWAGLAHEPTSLAIAFIPITALTFLTALLVEYALQEGGLFYRGLEPTQKWDWSLAGWSRPIYLVGFLSMIFWQVVTLTSVHSGLVTGAHALLLALIGSVWLFPPFVLAALVLGGLALLQQLFYSAMPLVHWPIYIAVLGVVYGSVGYGLQLMQTKLGRLATLWQRPLQIGSWLISTTAVVWTITLLSTLVPVAINSLQGQLFLTEGTRIIATTAVVTYGITGLLFLATAFAEQKPRLSYGALLLLLLSWSTYMLILNQQNSLQLYALPTGLYLLAIGWLEWRYGNSRLAVWVDYAGFLLLLGSLFYQSFGDWGRLYALLMVVEGLLLVWAGSWRRMRRYLYAGITAVVLGIGSQMINPILDLNAFVLLALGLLLVLIGIGLERRLDTLRDLAKKFRPDIEKWE